MAISSWVYCSGDGCSKRLSGDGFSLLSSCFLIVRRLRSLLSLVFRCVKYSLFAIVLVSWEKRA